MGGKRGRIEHEVCDLPTRTLAVCCPAWPLRALGVTDDEPAVVVSGRVVVAASTPAGAAGIGVGLSQVEAEACCPGLLVHARDEAAEWRAFEVVALALESLGVPITLRGPGWAALATRGPARRLGGEAGLAQAVGALMEELALPGPRGGRAMDGWWRLGMADGLFAASLAALEGIVVARGTNAAFLAPLPIDRLNQAGLEEEKIVPVLRRLGIETLGSFAALDSNLVGARFGSLGASLHQLAAGKEPPGLPGRHPARSFQVGKELDPPTSHLEAALFVVRGLADELGRSLSRRGLACGLLQVEVQLTDGTRLERRWSGSTSTDPGLVAERLRSQLEAWTEFSASTSASTSTSAKDGDGDGDGVQVAGIRLVVLEAIPQGGTQLPLWGWRPAEEDRVTRMVARVQGILGPHSVLRPRMGEGRGPGERIQLVVFGEDFSVGERASPGGPRAAPRSAAPWPGRLPAPSPAVVPSTPVRAEMRDERGVLLGVDARGALSGLPVSLAVGDGPAEAVVGWSGPFPADERWWEGAGRRRRARLQVVLGEGDAYLVTLEGGQWAVEGRYD